MITHHVSKHVRLSEPTTKIWMKIDYTISDDDVANDSRFWQYKVLFMRILAGSGVFRNVKGGLGSGQAGPYPEMWSGGWVPKALEWRRRRCRRWWGPPQWEWDLERGLCPLPRKILTFSPSKWCTLMHSGARFRPTRPITAIMMSEAKS